MNKVVIVDAVTGEVIERAQTATEKAQSEKDQAEVAALDAVTATKSAARQAVLDRLGITADEAQLLLG